MKGFAVIAIVLVLGTYVSCYMTQEEELELGFF